MPDDKRHDSAKHEEEENEIESSAADEQGSELVSGKEADGEEGDEPGSGDEVAIDALLKAMPPEVRQAINSMPPELRGSLTSFTVSASIRSPFLPPNLLEAYENVVPGSAKVLIEYVKHQQEHQISSSNRILTNDLVRIILNGLTSFAVVAVAGIGAWQGSATISLSALIIGFINLWITTIRRIRSKRKAADQEEEKTNGEG